MLEINDWYWYGLFSLVATFFIYNAQRLIRISSPSATPWLSWVRSNRKGITALSILSGLIAVFLFLKLVRNPVMIYLLASCILISFFYVFRVRNRNLREIPYIKIILIAAVWTIVLIGFPAMEKLNGSSLLSYLCAHFIYVVAVTIPFDIRDLEYDKPFQRTLPQIVGVTWSKRIGVVLLFIFYGFMASLNNNLCLNPWFYAALLLQLMLILNMSTARGDLYTAGAIDGAISLLGISYFFS